MKALLLAAGKATRLGSLSATTPKCLHYVGSEPLLDRVVRQLQAGGVTEFLINTHHLADQITDHISRRLDSDRFTLVYEPELLGTLGTLRANCGFFEGSAGWVLHADNFIEGSLRGLRDSFDHRDDGIWASMLTFAAEEPSSCGVVLTDEHAVVTEFFEKVPEPPSNQASAATFIFGGEVMELVRRMPSTTTDISHDLLPKLAGRVAAVPHDGVVVDIGTPRGLLQARSVAERVE